MVEIPSEDNQINTVPLRKKGSGLSREICSDMVAIFNVLLIMLASCLAYALTPHTGEMIKYMIIGLVTGVFCAGYFAYAGYNRFDKLLSTWNSLNGMLFRWWLVLLGLTAMAFVTKTAEDFSRSWFILWALAGTSMLIWGRIITTYMMGRLTRNGGPLARRYAIVGATDTANEFLSLMAEDDSGTHCVGVFDSRPFEQHNKNLNTQAGGFDRLIECAQRGELDDVVICLPWSGSGIVTDVLKRLAILPVNTVLCPDMAWLKRSHGNVAYMGNVPLLTLHKRPLEGWGGIIKNIEDKALGSLALITFAPVMLIIALLVKLDSPGPVLFAQKRHGFNHEVFKIYKFRTMRVMEDGDIVTQATKDDDRITKLGAFLRRYSLDELPQFLNVVLGNMSLVGPRPHAVAHNEKYAQSIADYSGRHKVKPGITGWAQVNGLRGETSENEMMENRIRYDLHYIENWSLAFDIRILLLTVKAVLFPTNAY